MAGSSTMNIVLISLATLSTGIISVYAILQAWLIWQFLTKDEVASKKLTIQRMQEWPTVLVQLPIYNEGPIVKDMLEAVSKLDYPQDRLSIQVLDDSNDHSPAITAAVIDKLRRESHINITHLPRADRQGFKAGALANGMIADARDSEFIAIFDADFTPTTDFLRKTIPAFQSSNVALVQTRWAHRNTDESFSSGLMALALDNHFVIEQGGRQAAGCFVNFNGTAGVWRRAAIADAGGWSSDSLTEDLDLSFRAQMAGWECQYAMEIETLSEIPAVLSSLRTQQFRWTKGSTEATLKLAVPLLRSNVSLRQKVVGLLQLGAGIQYIAVLLFGLTALGLHAIAPISYLGFYRALSVLMTLDTIVIVASYGISQHTLNKQSTSAKIATAIKTIVFTVFVTGFSLQNSWAVIDALMARKSEFVRTPKRTKQAKALSQFSRFSIAFVCEALLAITFVYCAINEFIAWQPQALPLFPILTTYCIAFSGLVILSAAEQFRLVSMKDKTAAANLSADQPA